jgi:hypothetical protein
MMNPGTLSRCATHRSRAGERPVWSRPPMQAGAIRGHTKHLGGTDSVARRNRECSTRHDIVASGAGKNINISIRPILEAYIDRQTWMISTRGTTRPMDFNRPAPFVVETEVARSLRHCQCAPIPTMTHHRLPNMTALRKDAKHSPPGNSNHLSVAINILELLSNKSSFALKTTLF